MNACTFDHQLLQGRPLVIAFKEAFVGALLPSFTFMLLPGPIAVLQPRSTVGEAAAGKIRVKPLHLYSVSLLKSKTRLGKACLTQASFKVVGMASRSLFAGGLTPSEAAAAPAPGTAAPAAALCAASSATKTLSRACLWSCVSRYACSLHIYRCMKEDKHQCHFFTENSQVF